MVVVKGKDHRTHETGRHEPACSLVVLVKLLPNNIVVCPLF
jgi:hypothetical protein